METWCCALDFCLVHTFYNPQTLHRHLSLRRMRCGIICHANIDPLLFSCSLLVSLPSGQQTFGNVKKKVDVQFHIRKSSAHLSGLLIAWGFPSDKGVPRHQLPADSMFQKFHHIFVATLISLSGHTDICAEPRNYYVRVLPKVGHYRQFLNLKNVCKGFCINNFSINII